MDEVAYGFIRVANEAMARPIRNLTTMKGYDVTKHVLSCFGGAGPQHCCAIAKSLGMSKIVVHQHSGILLYSDMNFVVDSFLLCECDNGSIVDVF